MARLRSKRAEQGFSLVELLVALVFTMVLMAGMANVYKASLSAFYTTGEATSSVRRNRLSLDLLVDDLNAACMYLTDLSVPPTVTATAPPFYILPNVDIANSVSANGDPTTGDELYFYLDQPLPFEGKISGAVGSKVTQRSAAEMVIAGVAPDPAKDNTFDIDCGSETYANQVKSMWTSNTGLIFIFKDSWEIGYISKEPTPNGKVVSVLAGASPFAGITGSGSAGLPTKAKHLPQSGIVFLVPAQIVRYRIAMLELDPSKPNGRIPCLVREQGTYSTAGFAATQPQQVIAENVSGFKTYLSTNSGTSWAGLPGGVPAAYVGTDGWDAGLESDSIRGEVDSQLKTTGRPDMKNTRSTEHWFRSVPTLVRVDLSTRTATQRAEYSTTGAALAYKNLVQSLVFVPKHSGLSMN
jgi:hypothetical protein